MSGQVRVEVGARLIRDGFSYVVVAIDVDGVTLRGSAGQVDVVPRSDLHGVADISPDGSANLLAVPSAESAGWLDTWLDAPEHARREALRRQEDVNEILTGFRYGDPALALPDEPRPDYAPGTTHTQRVQAKAAELQQRARHDRRRELQVRAGGRPPSDNPATVYRWLRNAAAQGLVGLLDGRSTRPPLGPGANSPEFADQVRREMARDGERSSIKQNDDYVSAATAALVRSQPRVTVPAPSTAREIAARTRATVGRTTTEVHSKNNRTLGHASAQVFTPGTHLSMDSTIGDVLLSGPITGRPMRVCPLVFNCVASGIIVEAAIVPRDVRALDVALGIFRACSARTMPELDPHAAKYTYLGVPTMISTYPGRLRPDLDDVDPSGLLPASQLFNLRGDGAGANTAPPTMEVLRRMEATLVVSRPGNSQDNSLSEVKMGATTSFWKQFPTYTSGSLERRGKNLDLTGLVDATHLDALFKYWAFAIHNHTPSSGLVLPFDGALHGLSGPASPPGMSPAARYDALLARSGAIQVLSDPFVLYDLLPRHEVELRDDGIEVLGVRFDGPWLDEVAAATTNVPSSRARGRERFRRRVRAIVDWRDLSQVWLRHPDSGVVKPIRWRGSSLLDAPLAKDVIDAVLAGTSLSKADLLTRESLVGEAIADLVAVAKRAKKSTKTGRVLDAAAVRAAAATADHEAIARSTTETTTETRTGQGPSEQASARAPQASSKWEVLTDERVR